jgi:hypothetical protein
MADLIVQSKVKEHIKEGGKRMAGDFVDALDDKVKEIVDEAIRRADGNGKGTVKPNDL